MRDLSIFNRRHMLIIFTNSHVVLVMTSLVSQTVSFLDFFRKMSGIDLYYLRHVDVLGKKLNQIRTSLADFICY